MRRYAIVFGLIALVLTACRVETNINLDINEDGSAVVGFELGYDEEFKDLMGEQGFAPEDIAGDLPDLGGEGVRPINRTEGDMQYIGVETDVEDLSELSTDAPGVDSFTSFSYEFDEDTASLVASIDAEDVTGGAGDLPIDPGAIAGNFFSANVIVKMPGSVTSHNANEVRSDGALVWNIPLSGSVDIEATSDLGSESNLNFILLIVAGVIFVGAIAAIAAVVMSRRSREQAAVAAAASAPAAEPVTDSENASEISLDLHESDDTDDSGAGAETPDEDQPDST